MHRLTSACVHSLEGRLRINVPKIKRALREALEVELRLHQVPGVREVSASAATGNVLIHYDPGCVTEKEIISALINLGYFSQLLGEGRMDTAESDLAGATGFLAVTLVEAVLSRLVSVLL